MSSPHDPGHSDEIRRIHERYAARDRKGVSARYSVLAPDVYMSLLERDRVLIEWLRRARLPPPPDQTLLEVGCGSGSNLLGFLRLGFAPENLVGNELREDAATRARFRLPAATRVVTGDATTVELPLDQFHVVFQATVFSSILDARVQEMLARRMWSLVTPGGGVLWYDFVYDNPRNPDVRGVPVHRVRALFPEGRVEFVWTLTLAPPISRLVTRLHPSLYTALNLLPFLRTHRLCWITKR